MLKFVHNIRDKIIGLKNALIYLHYKVGGIIKLVNFYEPSMRFRNRVPLGTKYG